MTHQGATVHLDGGRVIISTDSITLPSSFEYGANEHNLKVFIMSYAKFLYDSPLETVNPKPWRVVSKFIKQLTTTHIRDVIRQFSRWADEILSNEYSTGPDSSTRVYHAFMKETPIFKEYHLWQRTGRPELLRYVLSFLRFGKKLNYEDGELDSTALRGWIQVEERLNGLVFNDKDIASLRTIVKELVGPLAIDHVLPKFGRGRVAEAGVEGPWDKLECLYPDPILDYAFSARKVGYYKTPNGKWCPEGWDVDRKDILRKEGRSSTIARLKFVPKDITKSRSICMEPNTFMYFQQAVLSWVKTSLKLAPISRFVKLEEQEHNREAAIHGSKYLSSDTIDLSSASDSVSVDLVRQTFPSDWLFYLLATRTSRVQLPDGSVRAVKKFAPMGSALCFPTQCIIFTAVCVYAYIAHVKGKTTGSWICSRDDVLASLSHGVFSRRSINSPFGKELEIPVVYGDDIVTDSRVTDSVISLLTRLGFSVNEEKSFRGSQSFRESCGVYAYEGDDVTPFLYRLPLLTKGKGWDAQDYASLIENVNLAGDAGHKGLAAFWLSMLKEYGFKYPLPFVTDKSAFGLYTSNKHVPAGASCRINLNWQIYEEEVQGIGPTKLKGIRPENLDSYGLDQFWRSRVVDNSTMDELRSSTIRPQETRLAPVWARCE